MKIEFGYGCGSQTLCVPDENVLGVLQQNELALPEKTARELVAEAIAHPIGCPPLRDRTQGREDRHRHERHHAAAAVV